MRKTLVEVFRESNLLKKAENPEDVISMDVPLLIRLLEYAREDAKTDMDLHDVAERLTRLSSEGKVLGMRHYRKVVRS
jgi:hypothetical protein